MMKYRSSNNLLVIPRPDGLLIVIDGECFMKPMTSEQFIHLASDCNTAAVAVMRDGSEEKNTA